MRKDQTDRADASTGHTWNVLYLAIVISVEVVVLTLVGTLMLAE
jgi:hypothetical protein